MKIGDIVQFKFNKKYRGQMFMVVGGEYHKKQWKSPKVKVMRVFDGKLLYFVSITALEEPCK